MSSSANQVVPNLWMGSAPPEGWSNIQTDFDYLALCAVEYQPEIPGIEVDRLPVHDDGEVKLTVEVARQALATAIKVSSYLDQGKRVLITCYAGRNRSGLVCALTLMFKYGSSANQAIQRIRLARGPFALSNSDFVDFLFRVERNIKES